MVATVAYDKSLWEKVQSLLNTHRVEHKTGGAAKQPSLLAGLLFDDQGGRLTPTHAVKKGKRYRYYISNQLTKLSRDEVPHGRRLPAGEIEQLVCDRIHAFLLNESELFNATVSLPLDVSHHKTLINKANQFSEDLQNQSLLELRQFLLNLITRIEVFYDQIVIHLICQRLHDIFICDSTALVPANEMTEDLESITLSIPAQLKRTGMEKKMLIDHVSSDKAKPDANLIKLVVKVFSLKDKFFHNNGEDIKTIAERENLTGSYFTRLIRINFLAPDIMQAILLGHQPVTLDAATLLRNSSKLPLDWKEQRVVLGFK